jgi:hypothetical protein
MHSPTPRRVPLVGPNFHILGLAVTISISNLPFTTGLVILLWH